jgi:predicted SAM-dependent methyltransferase
MTDEEIKLRFKAGQIKIDLGCGPNKRPGYIGVDHLPLHGVDIVCNLEEGLQAFPDNCADEILSIHFLEHIANFELLMRDIHRVLKPTGQKIIYVPHFSNPYYYSDYTHKRFFGLYTFDYFSKLNTGYRRKVINFYTDYHFIVVKRKLIFKSPFVIRNLFKQVLQRIFNVNKFMQEFYEENFCYMFPCQEIMFVIKKDIK